MLRYRVTTPDGRRVEHGLAVGLVRDFATEKDAWREVDRLGLHLRVNDEPGDVRIRFDALAEHYLKADFGEDAVRPKSENTIPIVSTCPRLPYRPLGQANRGGYQAFGNSALAEIPQRWRSRMDDGSKIRGIMLRVFKVGVLHEYVSINPVEHVETRCKTNYRAIVLTPKQTLRHFALLLPNPLHYALVLTCAATALRSSEILALRWADILWGREDTGIEAVGVRQGRRNQDRGIGRLCSHASGPGSAAAWMAQPNALCKSIRLRLSVLQGTRQGATVFRASSLITCGRQQSTAGYPSQRATLRAHNLRHSLSNWLVNKAKVQAKTVQFSATRRSKQRSGSIRRKTETRHKLRRESPRSV